MEGKHEDQPRGGSLFQNKCSLKYVFVKIFFNLTFLNFLPRPQGWPFQEVETGAGKV